MVYGVVLEKNIAALRQTARKIPFTMVFYITVSGKGFRILLRYMRPEGCNLTATELHQLAIRKAMELYDKLLGISSDKQCQDMVRSCGLAYDPEAYFNWNAEVLPITHEEVENFEKATKQQEEQNRKRQTEAEKPRKKSPRKQEDEAPPKALTTEEILQYVDKLAESWEERFEEHHHNSYVVRYATFCLCFGAEKEEAVKHMADKFGGEYADTERVAREIYVCGIDSGLRLAGDRFGLGDWGDHSYPAGEKSRSATTISLCADRNWRDDCGGRGAGCGAGISTG